MLTTAAYPSVFAPKPPPLWYVTNGDVTVGPVITTQLTRGVAHGRVPDDCLVRAWRGDWRGLQSVREIAALHKPPTKDPKLEQIFEWELAADRVKKDAMELCHTVAWLARMATGAECTMVHFRSRLDHPLRTRAIVGPMPTVMLGQPLPENDLALHAAFRGQAIVGPPFGRAQDALAIRFASSKNGVGAVAMVPLVLHGHLMAMLELGRPGHAFRRADLQRAERIAMRALRRRLS
jgi:hypothetical protein